MESTIPTLTQIWETDTTLITPESVIYDKAHDVYYVSCMGSNPTGEFDGNGYIAKVALDGEIIDNNWVTNLNDPKGLALVGNTLYVTDLNKVVTINTETGEAHSDVLEGAEYLNDAASAPNGDVIFTDTNLNTIFVKSGNETKAIFTDSTFQRLNGVYHEANRYLLAGFGSGKLFTLENNVLSTVAEGMNTADGIEAIGDGYFISCWDGHIYYVDSEWNKTLINDTSADKIGAADIDYIANGKVLVVPTFFGNKVVAYSVD
ncbi:MAG: hypothetical protein ACI9IP_001798 [Arcticibacterium sp.]|jgi:hypothetical protein